MTFDLYAGLDFSGAREPLSNLWSAVGIERDERLHILDLRPHPFREDAAHFIRESVRTMAEDGRALWGLDFPFSIPAGAAALLMGRRTPPGWPEIVDYLAQRTPDDIRDAAEAFQKITRQIDVGKAMAPLDLRIYKQTIEGVKFLHMLRAGDDVAVLPQAPQPEATITLIEVYPSITARDCNLLGRRPARPGAVRARPAQLAPYLTFDHQALEATAATLEDAWDAVLACLTAYLVRHDLDQPHRLATVPRDVLTTEGWIYRHPEAAAPTSTA